MKKLYCPKCDLSVEASICESKDELVVKGCPVQALQQHATCPNCKTELADEDMLRFNLDAAYNEYRRENELLTITEIHDTYERYGLSQASFAKLLDLGAATISRYENGALQTKQIDTAIRNATDPRHMLTLLQKNGDRIPKSQLKRAQVRAQNMLGLDAAPESISYFFMQFSNLTIELNTTECLSVLNGYRTLSPERVVSMALYFSQQCDSIFRLCLNRAFFYADYAGFATTGKSISGLVYTHASAGPIIDGYDALIAMLLAKKELSIELVSAKGFENEKMIALHEPDLSLFSREENCVLENVATFLNGFNTANELSKHTYNEAAWQKTTEGQKIPYDYAFELHDLERLTKIA